MGSRPFGTRRNTGRPRTGRSVACAAALLLLTLSGHAQEGARAAGDSELGPAPVVPAPSRPVLPAPEPASTPSPSTAPTPRPRAAAATAATRPEPAPDPLAQTLADLHAEVRALRAGNDRLDEANGRLTELNGQLRQEVEALALELQAARRDARLRGLLFGAGLILAGLLAGVLIKARPRRSAWS